MKKKKKYGVIPRKYDIPFDVLYEKNGLQQNVFTRRIENTLLQNRLLGASNKLQLPDSYILMDEDTNKDGVINDNDIKVESYGGIYIRVENQKSYGLCWAFASLNSLETNLALNGYGEYDFSELHLDYLNSNLFKNTSRYIHEGGSFSYFQNYINLGEGPVLEEDVPNDSEFSNIFEYEYIQNLSQIAKVDEVDFINMPSINKNTIGPEDLAYFREKVKEHIMKNGSLSASVYSGAIINSTDNKNKVLNNQKHRDRSCNKHYRLG